MKLEKGKEYTILDLGYHIALSDDKKMTVKGAVYQGRGTKKMGALESSLLIFKKDGVLYGCDWAISRAEATETKPRVFLEVLKRGAEVKQWNVTN